MIKGFIFLCIYLIPLGIKKAIKEYKWYCIKKDYNSIKNNKG